MSFVTYLKSSLDTTTVGASLRKLAAASVLLCVIAAHISWIHHCIAQGKYELLPEVFIIDFGFIASCLGLTTYETITKMKEGNKQENIVTKEENKQTNIEAAQ